MTAMRAPFGSNGKQLVDFMPPHDLSAEAGTLGSVILDPRVMTNVRMLLPTPELFFKDENQIIYRIMCELSDAGEPIDAMILWSTIKTKHLENIVPFEYVKEIACAVPTTAHAEYYAAIVREKSERRSVITLCTQATREAYEFSGPSAEVVNILQVGAAKIAELGTINVGSPAGEYLDGVLEEIHGSPNVETGGLPTGLQGVDAIIGGMKKKHLIVIAGHGKHGKTALGLGMVANVGLHVYGEAAAVISFEMTAEELTKRLLLWECRTSEWHLRHSQATSQQKEQYERAKQAIRECKIVIDDDCPPTMASVRTRLHLYKRRYNISVAMVDYYQLMEGADSRARRYDHLVEISRGFKKLACELDMPLIVLAQLNAEAEKEDRLPRMNDIEECKRLAKDANVVMLLDREFMRKRNDQAWLAEHSHQLDRATLDVAGIRGGAGGVVELAYEAPITRFRDRHAI